MKFNFQQILKSFIPKKIFFKPLSLNMPQSAQKMALAVLIFSEGFGPLVGPVTAGLGRDFY